MLQSDLPSSDPPLLAALSVVVSVMIGFGLAMYSLMQPTVLPNAPFDLTAEGKRAPIILRATPQSPPLDVEQSAIATAARENKIQGLQPTLAAKAVAEPSPTQAHAQAAPRPAKRKRAVARAPKRAERAYATNWWGGHSLFGGFGSW